MGLVVPFGRSRLHARLTALPKVRGRQLYDYLLNELPWYRVTYQTRGITIRTPRWTTVFGKDDSPTPATDTKVYKIAPRKIPEALEVLLEHMQERTGKRYNFVLVNLYENGKDSISWHSDEWVADCPIPGSWTCSDC